MSTKNNHVKIKTWLMEVKRRTKLIRIQNPGGHKEGRASFPIQFQFQVSRIHTSTSTPREVKRRTEREREREETHGREAARLGAWKREKEREWERGYLCPLTLELKD